MAKKKKRTADDYKKAAQDSMILAETLAGQKPMSDQEFLRRMARSDDMVEHRAKCGLCHNIILGAQVARDMLEAGEKRDVISKWAEEARRRWQNSKYYKLWQKEVAAGRDPKEAFKKRGWEP